MESSNTQTSTGRPRAYARQITLPECEACHEREIRYIFEAPAEASRSGEAVRLKLCGDCMVEYLSEQFTHYGDEYLERIRAQADRIKELEEKLRSKDELW